MKQFYRLAALFLALCSFADAPRETATANPNERKGRMNT